MVDLVGAELGFNSLRLSYQELSESYRRAAVAQEVERVVHQSEDRRFESRLLQSACRSVLGQDTEPQIAPEGCAIGV